MDEGNKQRRDARGRFAGARGAGRGDGEPTRSQRLAVQGRAPRRDGWTAERRAQFFAALADSCNIKASCGAVNLSVSGAYQLKDRDAGFRRGWRRALTQGYDKLELNMLERALIGERRLRRALETIDSDERAVELLTRYTGRVAETLYRAHRATVLAFEAEDDEAAGEAAQAEIEARLARLRTRLAREADGQ